MSATTATTGPDDRPTVRRRAGRPAGGGETTPHSFRVEDDTWQAALEQCHRRGVSLGSQLVRALERIAAGETL